ADADNIGLAEQLAPVLDRGHMQMRFDVMARFRTHIGHPDKLNAGHTQILRSMVLAERAGAYDGGPQRSLRGKLMNGQRINAHAANANSPRIQCRQRRLGATHKIFRNVTPASWPKV